MNEFSLQDKMIYYVWNYIQIILYLAVATVICAPQSPETSTPAATVGEQISILKFQNEGVNPDGSYQWNYETSNGISAKEQGELKNAGNPETEEMEVSGSYEYTGDDGIRIQVSYIANKDGFQPQGDILPTPPPIPPVIQRALEWIAAHPEENDKKSESESTI